METFSRFILSQSAAAKKKQESRCALDWGCRVMVWISPQQLYTYIVAGIKYVFKKYPAEIHSDATGQVCAEDYGCLFYEQDVPNTRRMLLA